MKMLFGSLVKMTFRIWLSIILKISSWKIRIFGLLKSWLNSFNKTNDITLSTLNGDFRREEIKMIINFIGNLKVPRQDGYPAALFQRLWNICE